MQVAMRVLNCLLGMSPHDRIRTTSGANPRIPEDLQESCRVLRRAVSLHVEGKIARENIVKMQSLFR